MRNTPLISSPPPAMAMPTPTIMIASHRKRRISFPSLAFSSSASGSYAMDISLKATPSPPSTSSSSDSDYLFPSNSSSSSLSSSPTSPASSGSFTSVSHPDWPRSDTLSSPSSTSSRPASCSVSAGGQASCYISDEDFLDLASLPLYNNMRIPEYFGVYGCGNPALTAVAYAEEQELPPTSVFTKPKKLARPVERKRRRSKECRRKPLGIMTPISESGE